VSDWQLGSLDEEALWRQRLEAETEEMVWLDEQTEHNPLPERTSHMPSIKDIYGGSKGLKAADLRGRAHLLKVSDSRLVKFNDGSKIVLSFDGKEKELVVNKTNAQMIASKFGEDYERWLGAEIEVYPDKTQFNGELVDCIRVRIPVPAATEGGDDEIPF